MKVIDSSGWIEFASGGPLADRYLSHIKDPSRIITPSIVLYEVYKKLKRDCSEETADAIVAEIAKTRVIPLDDQLAIMSADTSLAQGLSMADAIVYTTALLHHATVITSDEDFKNLPRVIYMKR